MKFLYFIIIASLCVAYAAENKSSWGSSLFQKFSSFLKGKSGTKKNIAAGTTGIAAATPVISQTQQSTQGLATADASSPPPPVPLDESTLKAVDAHIQQAKSLIHASNMKGASESLLLALELHPDSLEANSLLGSCYLLLGRPELAEGFLYSAVRLSKWVDPVSIANLAEALRMNGDLNLAVQVAMKGYESLGRKDESGMVEYILGACYLEQKKYSIASEWFLAAAMHQPHNIDAWLYASTMKFPESQRTDYKYAENVLLQGMQENPNAVELVFQMGMVMFYTQRSTQAIKCFDFVIKQEPAHKQAHAMLATALHAMGSEHAMDALSAYNEAIKYNTDNAVLHANFGLLLHSEFATQGQVNTDDIVRLADRALQLDPSIEDAARLVNKYRKQPSAV